MLRWFGFHFYWTKGTKTNYKKHESQIAEFVEKLSSIGAKKTVADEGKIKSDISKWIKENCVIALP